MPPPPGKQGNNIPYYKSVDFIIAIGFLITTSFFGFLITTIFAPEDPQAASCWIYFREPKTVLIIQPVSNDAG
jgi:hypothetical protein